MNSWNHITFQDWIMKKQKLWVGQSLGRRLNQSSRKQNSRTKWLHGRILPKIQRRFNTCASQIFPKKLEEEGMLHSLILIIMKSTLSCSQNQKEKQTNTKIIDQYLMSIDAKKSQQNISKLTISKGS